jgi:hypothetical protein
MEQAIERLIKKTDKAIESASEDITNNVAEK